MTKPKISAVSTPTLHQSEVAQLKRARGKAAPPDGNAPESANDNRNATAIAAAATTIFQPNSAGAQSKVPHEAGSGQSDSATYDIGYKKPPKHTQFKKGQSGNPKGRAKGARNIWTILQEEAQIVVPFSENGKPTKASKQQLAIKTAMNKAVKGDLRALQIILKLFETHAPSAGKGGRGSPAETPAISRQEMDREILDMLGLSDNLSPSEASPDDPPTDDTEDPQN